ncbi:MAG: hypothetical protein ABEJ47_01210, partial [Halorhabdus sp.]
MSAEASLERLPHCPPKPQSDTRQSRNRRPDGRRESSARSRNRSNVFEVRPSRIVNTVGYNFVKIFGTRGAEILQGLIADSIRYFDDYVTVWQPTTRGS